MNEKLNPNDDTNSIYFSRLHWILFCWPAGCMLASLLFGLYFPQIKQIALIFFGFSFIWIFMTWVTYYYSSITIQKRNIILRKGMLVRQTVDIPLSKIESIDIRQTIMGSILNYGTIIITGTGGTKELINYLDQPLTCRRHIEQLLSEH